MVTTKQGYTDIQSSLREEIRKGTYQVKIAPSDLVDFGGQRAYDLTHQLFIRQNGAFLLLLDGRKNLYEALPEYQHIIMTTMNILLHWVNSILTYCSPDDDDIYPLVAFAATHRDELTEQEQQRRSKEITKQLTSMFSKHEHCKRIKFQQLFFINATDRDDPGVKALKQFLVNVAFQQKSWGEKMPMAWVPLELQMADMRSQEKFVISYNDLNDINKNNDELSLTDTQLKQFLNGQHSLSRIMFFDIPKLNQFIIVQPTAMVDILRSFITDEMFWPKEQNLRCILSSASEKGTIKKGDLIKLWMQVEFNKYIPTPDMKEFIIRVLVHLDILVEPKRFNRTDENLTEAFIVPGMIRESLPSKLLPLNLDHDKTIILAYRLLKSAIPNALAYKLIGALLNIWPLKRKDGLLCLFDKAAILEIDQANDLYLTFKDNRFIVALFNTKSKHCISPDIASITKECLTFTMEKVLEFYLTSFGKSGSKTNVATLFATDVCEKCVAGMCFTDLSNITDQPCWTCENKQEHSTRFASYWSFDQKQEMCGEHCTGLFAHSTDEVPEDKHLIRLAKHIVTNFYDFIINLGLKKSEWEDIEDNTTYPDRLTKRFVGLCECKNQRKTFRDFSKALTDSGYNQHFLCQVFIEGSKEIYDIATVKLQETPDDGVLNDLSQNIGNCAMSLGVELGLKLPLIEHIIYRNIKDMFGQNLGVLLEWKKRCNDPTIVLLMKALHQADKRGVTFLIEKYNIYK